MTPPIQPKSRAESRAPTDEQNSSTGSNSVIAPGAFTPSSAEPEIRRGLSRGSIALLGAAALALLVLGFLFTARSVTFSFVPENAQFKLDGLLQFELGGTYLAFPGEYSLTANAAGYEPFSQRVGIAGERNQYLEFELKELPGRINLSTAPAGAEVIIDGQNRGQTPLTELLLPRGEYSLLLRRENYEDHQSVLAVAGLDALQSPVIELLADWADVEITTTPPGATVSIAGELSDYTTPAKVPVPSGFQELTLKLPGYKSFTTDVDVVARVPQTLTPVELELADGLVTVITNPSGAGITANGRFFERRAHPAA